jgi:hypothetical protein
MAPLQQHIEDINDRVDANFNEAGTQIVAGNAVKDEDNMASDSATHLATQQSIKAYVDTQIGASDLDLSADSGTNIAIDLDTEVLDLEGGTGIDTATGTNKITFGIDSTVATLTGSQTLTNKTINSASNTLTVNLSQATLTGTFAQFNTAVSDATLVDLDDTQTLTNKTINFENNTAIVVYAVTESGGNFLIDGEANATISFRPGVVHRFDVSDSSVASHPFVLSETSEGTAYTTGRTASGSQGSANAYIQFTVNADTPDNLFYYCSSHSGMGGKIGVFGSTLEAGSGLTITGNSIAVDATVITGQTNEGTADNNDVILIYDDSASGLKKQTRSAFLSGTGVGNMNSFNISDGSTSETISDANTITFSGTSNEVEVVVSATDTVTIGLPSTITVGLSATSTLASGVTATTQSAGDNSTKVATTAYVDSVSVDDNLTVGDGSATTVVDLDTQQLTIAGTANEIETTATAQTLTISLPATINANTTGNAATATALATPRAIAGNNFDGTAPITIAAGDLSDVSTSGVSNDQVLVYNSTSSQFEPGSVGSATALIDGDSDFTLTDGIANGIHYELDNTDMADWNQAGVVLSTAGGIFQHNQVQAATYTVPANTGSVMAGPITITGTVTNNGTLVVI